MKVRTRSRLILVVTIIVFLTVLSFISQSVIIESFRNIERQEMTSHVERAVSNLNEQQDTLAAICDDWASHEETYDFMAANGKQWESWRLPLTSSEGYEIDYVLMYNASGNLEYAERSGKTTGSDDPVISELDSIVRHSIIPEGYSIGISGRYGMSSLGGNPIILTGAPIIHANQSDPPRGTLIIGRTLDNERLQALESVLQVPEISIRPYQSSANAALTPDEENRALKGGIITRPTDSDRFEGITMITGIENKPTPLILNVKTNRPVFQQVQSSLFIFACTIMVFSAIFLITVQLLLQRFILGPISSLDNEVKLIGGDSSIAHRVDESGDDEIVSLKRSLNRMLDEIQRYHEELKASQETLEERNLQLAELNRKANLYLDIYLDVITYEILNALMGLRGYADIIRSTASGEEVVYAGKIESIVKKSADVIRNIETISQIYKNPPQNRPIDLGATIRKEAEFYAALPVGIEGCSRLVMANEMLGVVFNNLFSNSLKYGGNDVQIWVSCKDAGDGFVVVEIADDGPGISDGMKSKIFDRFTSDTKTRSSYGLGLHIVKMLIEGYGGKVWADDRIPGKPDKGAVIRFTLRDSERASGGPGEHFCEHDQLPR